MGVYYIAVNFDKKEWFSPKAVGANIKLRPLICNREFGAALSCLLVGRWHGDRVALAGDSDIKYDESYKDIGDIVAKEVETRIGGKFVPCSSTADDGIVFKEDHETPPEIEAQTPVNPISRALEEMFKKYETDRFQIVSHCWKCRRRFDDECVNPGKRNVLCPDCRTVRNCRLVSKIWNLTATREEIAEFEGGQN